MTPPRYLPDRPLPPYSYVPGRNPHPISHPAGHSFAERDAVAFASAAPLDPAVVPEEFLWGIDLFNHGFYWEAHEAWEHVWNRAGRRGREADLLKALIKLAAAAVKLREGNSEGRRRHLARCEQLLDSVAAENATPIFGVEIGTVRSTAAKLQEIAPTEELDFTAPFPGVALLAGGG